MSAHKPAKRTPKRAADRRLRELVFEALADATNLPEPSIKQMQLYVDWIKSGAVPGGAEIVRVERKQIA